MPDAVPLRASYFYLSYAHSPPLAGSPQLTHDQWVRTFFHDLSDAVHRLGSQHRGIAPGFFDQDIPLNSDWRASLTQAMSTAQVFIPLYAPGYFSRSWPGREWASFKRRLINAGVKKPLGRFAPVLWIPLKPGDEPEGLPQALAIGASESAYADNGLRAMLRLTPYRESYFRVVERLARQVVNLAESDTIPPSLAPDIDMVRNPFSSASAAVFAVAVAAADRGGSSAAADAGSGTAVSGWRPFPGAQRLSLAEYAATIAEQLDFAVQVTVLGEIETRLGANPGVVLVDPWFVNDADGRESLREAVRDRPWIMPVLVTNSGGDPKETELAQRVRAILDGVQPPHTDTARQAVAGVNSLEQFVALMPFLIAEAERHFLRRGPIERSVARPGSRRRLGGTKTDEEDSDG
ncbi:MAG TPA: TIR-like protein FxsC [Streptosporangiaceae bacterium]